ncbi:MAG: SPFH/Band 7/PHB domain protein [Mycoplasmatales bacterium]|nr:SPFH/Band 7/PHB domain protein [Mycoplasmatales bacterium]
MIIGIILGILGGIILIILISGFKIVPQTSVYIIERFGSYKRTLKNGINFIVPLMDRVIQRETIKERVLDFPAQDVITKDNVTMKIDTVVYMQITDPKLYAYGVEKPLFAVENLTATTLRNLIGDLELDQTLTSRDSVNEKLRAILDNATDPWGIKVLRVELKNILPPEDIRRAMEKQMRAEREKREQILVAEGTRAADILRAEGLKQASILEAEGLKQASILEAEGKKAAIELINKSKPTKAAITIRGLDALVKVSEGESTTILLPSELTEVTKFSAAFSAVNKEMKK